MANNPEYKKVLLIRFSAIGDVAMTVPVVQSLALSYPETEFTFLSNARFAPFFDDMPANFRFLGVDLKKDYHGTAGIRRLFKELKGQGFQAVADLHGVLRTGMLSFMFRSYGIKVCRINKDRMSRHKLTRAHMKDLTQRKSSFERYHEVLEELGFDFSIKFTPLRKPVPEVIGEKECRWIGVAPFAAHAGKIYPLDLMERVVAMIDASGPCRQFVFAYGKELDQVSEWARKYKSVEMINPSLGMRGELALMSNMDVMLAMDSSNMHLASLAGTRVVSVWGATHVAAGFLGYGQKTEDCVQVDLPCRPCSIYGKKECRYGDYRCMRSISPETIFRKLALK